MHTYIDFVADGRFLVLNSGQVTTRLIHMYISLHVLAMRCNGWLKWTILCLLVYVGTPKGTLIDALPTHMASLSPRLATSFTPIIVVHYHFDIPRYFG